ncbi:MAG: hypothetical protein PHH54_00020 [Candidatus Nanoarchaeia archaeon]|nr:hypothetical protein [Candidatus Nanoarchaeia archaeon]MDD5740348.1 hypothetical protein [Candidatus Nanoarchaeia archaeon]
MAKAWIDEKSRKEFEDEETALLISGIYLLVGRYKASRCENFGKPCCDYVKTGNPEICGQSRDICYDAESNTP